jgi:hypothetical protein
MSGQSANQHSALENKKRRKPRRPVTWALIFILVSIIFALFASWWIMIRMPGNSYRGPLPAADSELASLAEQLRRDVAALSDRIGERNIPYKPAELAKAAVFIESEFQAAGLKVQRQEFQVQGGPCSNLEVEIPGTARPDEIVVVGAHYDTVFGTPGANDNASGVAAVLALARKFSKRRIDRTLRFVAFVNEEPFYFQTEEMGSLVYARRCRQRAENITAMLSLETIGFYDDAPGSQKYPPPFESFYPSEGNFIGFIGNVASGDLIRRAVASFRRNEPFPCEGAALAEVVSGVGLSDQWSFWQAGYPAFMVTDTAMLRYPYYHHAEDTVDKINFDRMSRVVRGLEKVIAELVGE